MKTLIIVRHGKAMESGANNHDLLRVLAPRGEKDAKLIAKELAKKDLVPGLIVTSPALRALQTAQSLAQNLEVDSSIVITRDSLYGNLNTEVFGFLDDICPEERMVMIVGHNPALVLMIEYLSGLILESFPTTATLILDFDVEHWSELTEKKGTLRKLLVPAELRK